MLSVFRVAGAAKERPQISGAMAPPVAPTSTASGSLPGAARCQALAKNRGGGEAESMDVLAQATSPGWTEAARRATSTILLDHAHCEKKAASTAVGFLFRYPERAALVQAMCKVAREELV